MKAETEKKTVDWLNKMSKNMSPRQQALLLNLTAGCCKEADNPTPEVAETPSERRARKAKEAKAMGALMGMGKGMGGMGLDVEFKPPKKPGEPLDVLYVPEPIEIPTVEEEPEPLPEPPQEAKPETNPEPEKPDMTPAMAQDLADILSGAKDFGIPPEVIAMIQEQYKQKPQTIDAEVVKE